MKNKVLISVVVLSYNRAEYVSKTLDSILMQKVDADLEIVIGDDCSTDNAREVLLDYKEKNPEIIKLLFHDRNLGIAANWATCVKACSGKYICNCDNDDYWHNPNKLQIQLDYMENNSDFNICVTDYRIQNCSSGITREMKTNIDRTNSLQRFIFNGMPTVLNSTIMYRADFLKSNVPLDDFIKLKFTLQDWPALIILSEKTDKIGVIRESTTTNCQTESVTRPHSVENLELRLRKEMECYEYCKKYFCKELLQQENSCLDGWNAYVNERLFQLSYHIGDYKNAHKYSKHVKGHKFRVCLAQTRLTFGLYQGVRKLICCVKK